MAAVSPAACNVDETIRSSVTNVVHRRPPVGSAVFGVSASRLGFFPPVFVKKSLRRVQDKRRIGVLLKVGRSKGMAWYPFGHGQECEYSCLHEKLLWICIRTGMLSHY